jgi:hypothetical protein
MKTGHSFIARKSSAARPPTPDNDSCHVLPPPPFKTAKLQRQRIANRQTRRLDELMLSGPCVRVSQKHQPRAHVRVRPQSGGVSPVGHSGREPIDANGNRRLRPGQFLEPERFIRKTFQPDHVVRGKPSPRRTGRRDAFWGAGSDPLNGEDDLKNCFLAPHCGERTKVSGCPGSTESFRLRAGDADF